MENKSLILDLLGWLEDRPRPYDEVLAAWRSTCPRLTVWEDALDAGLVRVRSAGVGWAVQITDRGEELLRANGR